MLSNIMTYVPQNVPRRTCVGVMWLDILVFRAETRRTEAGRFVSFITSSSSPFPPCDKTESNHVGGLLPSILCRPLLLPPLRSRSSKDDDLELLVKSSRPITSTLSAARAVTCVHKWTVAPCTCVRAQSVSLVFVFECVFLVMSDTIDIFALRLVSVLWARELQKRVEYYVRNQK